MRAKIVKAMMGINQQKKAIIKQRLTSSVSIFLTSPYLTIKTNPRAAIPTTTIDQPIINHLKKSDKKDPKVKNKIPNIKVQMSNGMTRTKNQILKSKLKFEIWALKFGINCFTLLLHEG